MEEFKTSAKRYAQRGVSASKEDVHNAIKNIDKGLFPKAFCKIVPDYLTNDDFQRDFQERIILFEKLNKELENEGGVEVVNVKGMVSAIIVKDGDMGDYVTEYCVKNGVITVWTKRESVKLGPPLTISTDAIVESMDVIKEAIRSYNG